MKILQINAVNEYSSTGRTTSEMHDFLIQHGIDSYVCAVNIKKTNKRFIRIGNPISISIHSLLSHVFGLQGYFSWLSTKFLIKKINQISPDIVHLRNLHSNYINLYFLLSYLAKKNIPTVLTLHDFWFITGHCCYFVDTGCNKWKDGCGNCPDLRNWNSSWFFDTTRKCISDKEKWFGKIQKLAVVGVSDWVTNFLDDSILKNAYIKQTIYNWVDTNVFKPSDNVQKTRSYLKLKENDFVILGCAQNWTKTKGLDDFVALARRLPNFKFVLVGKILDTDLRVDNIINPGVTSSTRELAEYYSMADVFFNPTLRETFGKVTIEALACGTPVIGYNVTATPELISSGCGYVTDAKDIDAVECCLNVIQKRGKSSYSAICRQYTINKFSKPVLMNQYLQLYHRLNDM